jgi:sec-independent protein translocase protein TatB
VFDIAWSELALIAAVALIVIGPKDLPRVMRNIGQWTRRARTMAAEFQRNLDDMMREAELDEIRKEVEKVSPADFKANLEKMVDVQGIKEAVKIDPAAPVATRAPEPASTLDAAAIPAPEPTPEPDSIVAPPQASEPIPAPPPEAKPKPKSRAKPKAKPEPESKA